MSEPVLQSDLRLARTGDDLRAVHRLRYDVFVTELGGGGASADHAAREERDRFDGYADHLALFDRSRPRGEDAVAAYRLISQDRAASGHGFYSAGEFDLSVLERGGRRMMEFGRSCVRAEHRNGTVLFELWRGLAERVQADRSEILFGVASFHGTDPARHAAALSLLHHRHLAPADLRVKAIGDGACPMDLLPPDGFERAGAVAALPPLLKSYLRLGGFVGEGAWIDRAFNTIDVCLVVDVSRISARARALYARGE